MGDIVVVGDTNVTVKKGDITKETSKAIINFNNATLDLNSGVSKDLLAAAGPVVKAQCAFLAQLPNNGVAVTGAGDLKCQKIIHLIDVTPDIIIPSVKKALKACDQNYLDTVSLPVIGTDTADLRAQNSVKSIMSAIEEYLVDPTITTKLSKISIVVVDDRVYRRYQTFLQNYQTNYHSFTAFGKTIELIKGDITDQPVDCILNLTNKTLDQSSGVSGAILTAAGDEVKKECKTIGLLLTGKTAVTSGGKSKAKHIMHIIGPTTVPDYEPATDMVLLECNKNKFKSLAIPAIGTGMARIAPEASIHAILNSILKYLPAIAIPSLEIISIVVIQEPIYQTYLKVFQEKCTELQAQKREELIAEAMSQVRFIYPSTWTNTGQTWTNIAGSVEVKLDTNSTEFREVAANFLSTSGGSYQVVKIVRIENVRLWQSFLIKKQAVNLRHYGQRNLRHLYHGTSTDCIANINKHGFNRIYCGRHGTARGKGTYFAVKSNYSCQDTYSAPDSQGHKHVYQAMVITGKYCPGNQSLMEPPYINDDPNGDRYDSVVDNLTDTTYFVVFHDDYAYPEYLITFKPSSSTSATSSTPSTSLASNTSSISPTSPASRTSSTSPASPASHTSSTSPASHTSSTSPASHTSPTSPASHTSSTSPASPTSSTSPASRTSPTSPASHTSSTSPASRTLSISPTSSTSRASSISPTSSTSPASRTSSTSPASRTLSISPTSSTSRASRASSISPTSSTSPASRTSSTAPTSSTSSECLIL